MERLQATPSALSPAPEPKITVGQINTLERPGKGGGRVRSEWGGVLYLLAQIAVIVATFFIAKHATFGDVVGEGLRISRQLQQAFKGQAVRPGTALLLDSNPATRFVTKASLEQQGYTVLLVGSKREALEILDDPNAPIALIVTPGKLFDKALIVPGAQILITN